MKKRVYLTTLEYNGYEKDKHKVINDNVNVRGNIVFYNSMSYDEYEQLGKLANETELYLYTKDEAILEKLAIDEGKITIPIEEYKELLITKGKYEELLAIPVLHTPIVHPWQYDKDTSWNPYKITCNVTNSSKIDLDDDKTTDDFFKNTMGVDTGE